MDCVFGALAMRLFRLVSAPGWVVDVWDDGWFYFRNMEGVGIAISMR